MGNGYFSNDKIIWTNHVVERMIARSIGKKDVESVIQNPIQIIKDKVKDNYRCFGKISEKEPKYLIVVYGIRSIGVKIIITALTTDKGGVRAHGFNNI